MLKPFQPFPGATLKIANAASASSPAALPQGADQVTLYNSSATAIAFVRISNLQASTDTGQSAVADQDQPIPPGALIRMTCGFGYKAISAIASAADGDLYVTPGHGD